MLYSRLSDIKIINTCIVPLKKKEKKNIQASRQQQQQQQQNELNYKIVLVWFIDIRPLASTCFLYFYSSGSTTENRQFEFKR